MQLDETHTLVDGSCFCPGKTIQGGQSLGSVEEIASGQLAKDNWMDGDQSLLEGLSEIWQAVTEVVDPNGGVSDDHSLVDLSGRCLFGTRSSGICPPKAASRRAASRSTSASSPIRTSAVFSFSPVYSTASASRDSSMLSVVLICINMHQIDASGQWEPARRHASKTSGRAVIWRLGFPSGWVAVDVLRHLLLRNHR